MPERQAVTSLGPSEATADLPPLIYNKHYVSLNASDKVNPCLDAAALCLLAYKARNSGDGVIFFCWRTNGRCVDGIKILLVCIVDMRAMTCEVLHVDPI